MYGRICNFWSFKKASSYLFYMLLVVTEFHRSTKGMQLLDSGLQTIQKAQGESVVLGCRYTTSPADVGDLDIEWSVISPDTTQKDQMLVSYSSGSKYIHSENALSEGMDFATPDPSLGDASLSITALSPAHSATYQCKVKKSPGVDILRVSLVVMEKPSVPRCWVEGPQMVGEPLTLHCKSASGSGPLTYTWKRQQGPPGLTGEQGSAMGELRISNHSHSSAGLYLCEVNNAVGAEQCQIHLRANTPPNRAAVIVGTVIGSILLILILLLFIGVMYWKLRGKTKRRYDKDFSNEIREDVPPPESRPTSRHTTRSSAPPTHLSYAGVGGTELSWSEEGQSNPRSSKNQVYTPLQYDATYGYAV